jgi:galanin receptor 1/allatostatin receptor
MASASTLGQTRRRTARASKVIILVVVVFAVLWLPLHVNQLLSVFGTVPNEHWYEVFRVICNCLAYGNSCANPIIYNFVSKEFKRGFREVVCCKKSMVHRRNGTMLNTDGLATDRTAML